MQETTAIFFMETDNPTEEQLKERGGVLDGEWWKFPDGSKGKFVPYQGRFIAFDD